MVKDFWKIYREWDKVFYTKWTKIDIVKDTTELLYQYLKKNVSGSIGGRLLINDWLWYWFKLINKQTNYFTFINEDSEWLDFPLLFQTLIMESNFITDFHAFCYFMADMFNPSHQSRLFNLEDINEIVLTDNPDAIIYANNNVYFVEFCLLDKNKGLRKCKRTIDKHLRLTKVSNTLNHKTNNNYEINSQYFILWMQMKDYDGTHLAHSLSSHPLFSDIKIHIINMTPDWKLIKSTFVKWECYMKYI